MSLLYGLHEQAIITQTRHYGRIERIRTKEAHFIINCGMRVDEWDGLTISTLFAYDVHAQKIHIECRVRRAHPSTEHPGGRKE